MLEKMKTWAVQVGIQKMGPSLIRGAITGLVGLMAAHQGLLAPMGITYDPIAQNVMLHIPSFQGWLLVVGTGAVMSAMTTGVQHTTPAVVESVKQAVAKPPEGESK